jgi:hypothetical protein
MKTLIAFAILITHYTYAHAQQTRFYDAHGNSIGTATTSPSGQTTFRDSRGSTTGTANTDSSGTTTFRDSRGTTTGKASGPPAFDVRPPR